MTRVKASGEDTEAKAQNQTTSAGGGAGTSAPAEEQDDARTKPYTDERLRSIARQSRRGLKDVEPHSSWREVAAACHVEPGR